MSTTLAEPILFPYIHLALQAIACAAAGAALVYGCVGLLRALRRGGRTPIVLLALLCGLGALQGGARLAPLPAATAESAAGGDETARQRIALGQNVWTRSCAGCHTLGIGGAPRLGDAADWSARLAQGRPALYANALGGFRGAQGVMPPRGGNPALSDEEVRSAVDFAIASSPAR